MAIKEKVLGLIRAAREKEVADLLPLVDDSPPSQPGRWTAKDNLAHLSAWRRFAATELDHVRTGASGAADADTSEGIEEFNARIHNATHDLPVESALADGRSSWETLLKAVDACSEEDLLRPRLRRPEQPAWQVIPGNTYFHVGEHLGYWHSEQGDEAAAEGAARWAHDLANATFTEDRHVGTADYNLGCFYALRGRADEAMPYLRRGIGLNPSLREWAAQDKDLDPIRSTPELARLLAGS